MPKICNRCGRPKTNERKEDGARRRSREHECEIAQVVKISTKLDDHPYVKTVHLSAVEPGGYLYTKTRGKKPEWEVIFRSHTKLEKLSEKTKRRSTKRRKRQGRKLKAPAGKKLEAPK